MRKFSNCQSSSELNQTRKSMVRNQMIFVLIGVVIAVSMGGHVCHKTIAKYTPEEFVNDIICNNRFYKQMLYKKVSIGGLH